MVSFGVESAKTIDKFHGVKINLWKFKIEMLSASMDLKGIIDGSEEAPPSNADPNVKNEYKRCIRKSHVCDRPQLGRQRTCPHQEL